MNLQKKPHHQNKIGKNCGGTRGLAGLPRAATESPEGYFTGQGVFPWEVCDLNPSWAA